MLVPFYGEKNILKKLVLGQMVREIIVHLFQQQQRVRTWTTLVHDLTKLFVSSTQK
jgi:hypothetical protein